MTSTPLEKSQITFHSETLLTFHAKKLISKHPGIYKGNLKYWLQKETPTSSSSSVEIDLTLLQLIKEGYYINTSKCIFPPHKINNKEKTLMAFIYKNNLSKIDYGILYELNNCKRPIKRLDDLSRIVLSQNWHDNEKEIKIQIQKLVLKKIIIANHFSLIVSWKLIKNNNKSRGLG